ncbi:MAG: Gfo/Idh/MocA family oxidoreductase [Opitutales bacterium]|nr:Gfo/Idh/MocA family oxidoreductase [Opitutales bacterium]
MTDLQPIRWAILGTGTIANAFATGLQSVPDAVLHGVASRRLSTAQAFAGKYAAANAYEGLEALLADPQVDVVYIATPHITHVSDSIACLKAGKHVLCEKPMAMDSEEARRVIETAQAEKRFFMEAMWTHCFPAMQKVRQLLEEEAIGWVRNVTAAFSNNIPFDAENRFFNKALGGGALLDLGIYPLALADFVYGEDALELNCQAHVGNTGVDEHTHISLRYNDGALASLFCSFQTHMPHTAAIYGSKGYIEFHHEFWRPVTFKLFQADNPVPQIFEFPLEGNGYNYEAVEVQRCIRSGLTQSPLVPWERSLRLMWQMQQALEQVGVTY